ncbi:MAG: 50S ribosomal protein L23 [Candidatus Paceibacterota bacterium]|jgi:large subunit ribosomal protein L23
MKFEPGNIIIRPRITEKAAALGEIANVYTFEVSKFGTKATVARAIKEVYKVTPTKVNIVKLPSKTVVSKGKKGSTKSVVKAYVYLKKGDKIDIA